jgi:hypothetical protein
VDAFLLSEDAHATSQERTNLRFHLAMVAAARLVGGRVYAPGQLRTVVTAGTAIAAADLTSCLKVVRESFVERWASTGDGPDKVAKRPDYVDFLLERALPTADA